MDKKQKIATEEIEGDATSAKEPRETEAKKKDESELEELKEKFVDAENRYKRALADYQNLQKRTADDKQDWIRAANRELLLRLLPVLDTLTLANNHVQDQGLTVSINQFLDTLKAEGIKKIDAKGKEFDPHTMECVVTEEGEDGKVLEELRAGYIMNDKILRPAQVKVGNK
jgi:molecular chaperone GrpE